ncbi:MAG: Secreted protein containing Cellulosome anchoring protein, partial [Planctomycetaceae bacterium]|nr:Secreted protein containing Cellulosome anchoring protein [Planctomycetaceae bacterium]
NVNEAPINLVLSATNIEENNVADASVGTVSETDHDSAGTFTYGLVAGAGSTDNSNFNISGNTLTITPVANFEAKNSYAIRIRVTDQGGLTFEKPFTINVTNVNEPPTDLALSATSIAENNAANATVGTISAIDPDSGSTFSYSLVGGAGSTDNGSFAIAGNVLKISAITNFEAKSTYALRIRVTDQSGLTYEKPLTINVANVNEAPTDLALSAASISENNSANAAVGAFNGIDPDSGSTFTYSLVAGTGSTDNASFAIAGNTLTVTPVTDFETKSSYTIRVRITDQGGLSFEKPLTINVINVNEAPGYLILSLANLAENNAINATVGTISGIDLDAGSVFTYSLVPGTGSTDNSSFAIVGNTLTISVVANFETKSSYAIRLCVTDQGGLTFEKPLIINVTNINEAPIDITLSTTSVAENNAANATVGTLSGTDPDFSGTFTYSLVAGVGSTDNINFAIAGNVLKISPITNFETKSSYAIRIRITDQGGLTFEKPLAINVTNANEAPTDLALSATSISENNAANAAVGTFNGTDPDAGNTFTYSLVAGTGSTDNASFAIAGNTLTVTPVTDFETKSSYAIRVRVTDQGGLSFEKPLTINVTNVNEAPSYLILSLTDLAENNAINATVGTISGIDPDAGSIFAYSLVPGTGSADNGNFAIVGNTLTISAVANYEIKSSYAIRLCVTDQGGLSFEKPLTINVTNINEAPTDLTLSTTSITENNAANATVGTLSGSDPDSGDAYIYSLVAGTGSTDNASFAITGNTLTIKPVTDFETKSSYAIRVRVTDQGGLSFEKPLTINVTNVNEAPTISKIAAQAIAEDSTTGILQFYIGDPESPVGNLIVTATSSNSLLIPNSNLVISGTGVNRSVLVTPLANQYGSAIITLSVSDGLISSNQTFQVNVLPVDDPTTITMSPQPILFHISSKAVLAVDPAAAISDVDSPTLLFAGSMLKVSGQSSKDTLSIIEQNGIDVKGKSVLFGGTVIGSIAGGTKAEALTVQFNAGATQNAIQNLLRSIGFKTTDKLAGSRIIKFQITNIGGNNTNNATRQIQVGP